MEKYNNYILMDNFRGFQNTVVPLKRMNFLVGENSSGKSSVLSLIKIITDFNFWYSFEFKTEEVNLGHSIDIISASSEDKSYFRIGCINKLPNKIYEKENNLINIGFLMTFSNKNGMPEPKILSLILNKNYILHIKVSNTQAMYSLENVEDISIDSKEQAECTLNSLIDFHKNGKGYKTLPRLNKEKFDIRFAIYSAYEELDKLENNIKVPFYDISSPNVRPIWLAPIRSRPKRTYDEPNYDFSPEGEHTPYLLSSIIGSSKGNNLKNIIERTANKSGLFRKLELKKYGRAKNSPFELDVVLDHHPLSIMNVGYGVSQSLPILAEIATRANKSWFIIQQPEVHLHPKAQAEIGELFYDAVNKWEQTILVETHSDYMIDRYRLKKSEQLKTDATSNANDSNSQILFFQRKEGKNYVYPIGINQKGEIDSNQPIEYREFFIREQMELLGL